MLYIMIACILGLIYIAWRTERIEGIVTKLATKQEEEEEAGPPRPPALTSFLPDEWTDSPWSWKSKEEERRVLENPNALQNPDDFMRGEIMQRLEALASPFDRVAFLTALRGRHAYLNEAVTGAVLKDESPLVRSWGAAHLSMEFRDYRNFTFGEGEAPLIVDYTDEMLADPDAMVSASLRTNPEFKRLPWSFIWLSNSWKDHLKGLTPLARLALMHNRSLSIKYVVALLNAETDQLGISRDEHAQLLFTASKNPHLVMDSRHYSRDWWVVEGDPNPPFEEYGQMWEAAVDKWMDKSYVPYSFIKYIQTTGKVKLAVYQKLLDPNDKDKAQFRKTIIEGCDVFRDKEVLKLAWSDPDEKTQETAKELIGNLKSIVGVK